MIILVLLVGLALRLISLNQSLWLDEATSGVLVRDYTFTDIITKFSPNDFHPPLYYLLLKAWSYIFGTSEVGLRSLSVLAGLATIYMVYLIGKELKIEKPYIASLLLATSGLHIYYSQEARMYALALLLVTLTVYSFVKIVKHKEGRIGEWALFGIFLAASTFTHYLTILMIPVYWLFAKAGNKNEFWWKRFVTSHIILVVLAIFWFPVFTKQFLGGITVSVTSVAWWNVLGRTSIKEFLLVPAKFILGRVSFDNNLVYGLIVAIVSLLSGYLFFRSIRSIRNYSLIWLWLTVPIISAALVGLFIPVFSYFRLLFVLPATYLILALGISQTKKQNLWLIVVISINLLSSFYYLTSPRFHRENWRDLVKTVEGQKLGSKSITLFPADSQIEAYRYYAPSATISGPSALSADFEQIWLMRYVQPIFDPYDSLREKVEDLGYKKESELDFNGVVVWKYTK